MKNKMQLLAFLAFLVFFPFQEAFAALKIDVSRTASEISDIVTETANGAADTVSAVTEEIKKITFLEKVKLWWERQQARVKDIKKNIDTVADAGKKAYGSVEDVTDSVVDSYESEKAKIEEEMNKAHSGNGTQTAMQLGEITKQMEERKKVLSKEYEEKTTKAGENLEQLQAMSKSATDEDTRQTLEEMMSAAASEQAEYAEKKKQIDNEGEELLNDSEYKALAEQKKSLEEQMKSMGEDWLKSSASRLVDKLSKKDKAQTQREYLEVIDQNFLKEDEVVNQETTDRIMKYRRKTLLKDIENAFYVGTKKRIDLPERQEQIEMVSSNILSVDLADTSASLLIEIRIEELKHLFDYVELLIADMRLKTARNMLNQDYKLQDYDKNPAALNLDNYIFTEEDIKSDEGEKGFLENVKPK